MLAGKKILITGATGTIARPIAEHLVHDNEVWCAGRFSDPVAKRQLEAQGVKTCRWDMGTGDFSAVPNDFTHVLHSALQIGPSLEEHDRAITFNAEGAALLMQHCRRAEAFVHVSTFCVYKSHSDHPHHLYAETDALGVDMTFSASYPVSKIAGEGAVRAVSRLLDLPTTIARMNVGYSWTGGTGGLPVSYYKRMAAGDTVPLPIGHDDLCSPIGAQDIAVQSHALFEVASTPATIVNWAGNDPVSTREMCEYIAGLAGLEPKFAPSEIRFDKRASDNTRRDELIGRCSVHWKDGIPETLERRLGVAIR